MLKIESGIPVPRNKKQKSEERIAMESMAVGDSFAFSAERKEAVKILAGTLRAHERKKFTIRDLRVWRIE